LSRDFQKVRTEFKDISIQELKDYEQMFLRANTSGSGKLDLMELKLLMESVGKPQTHLALKAMIKEVDVDLDDKLSYSEFMLIWRYAKTGELKCQGLKDLASSVQVSEVGVGGAKSFFEKKAEALTQSPEAVDAAYHAQKRQEAADARARKAAFKDRAAMFQ
jgi:hypothetical protein